MNEVKLTLLIKMRLT